jgi:hypothetical protein
MPEDAPSGSLRSAPEIPEGTKILVALRSG